MARGTEMVSSQNRPVTFMYANITALRSTRGFVSHIARRVLSAMAQTLDHPGLDDPAS